MGNWRSFPTESEEDIWWTNCDNEESQAAHEIPLDIEVTNNKKRIKEELDEFKLELARKHEKRRNLIAEKKKEMEELREEVKQLKDENEQLREWKQNHENTNDPIEEVRQKNLELKVTIAGLQKELQEINAEVIGFEKERLDYKTHVTALKDVISVSKQMLLLREGQLKELKDKVREIEESLAGRELNTLSQDLRKEYEKQLQNIRNLRAFYDERQRADNKEKEDLRKVLEEVRHLLQEERDKSRGLSENVDQLEEEKSKKYDEVGNLESLLGLTKAESRQYQAELSVINQLFSKILTSFSNNQEVDIDKLIKLLEENHDILQDIAVKDDSSQVSVLPKVLLDLVKQISDKSNEQLEEEKELAQLEVQLPNQLNSPTEIAENLPKVWKVLIELLSHQSAPIAPEEKVENPCYKVVETPKGQHLVLSVSKTFIRLKDLIVEKKSLERETFRLKHLNTHLEGRLQEQEKRLGLVSKEVTETWHLVGNLQKKHQLLHTQEKILRYELAQKRKLLNELKEELEYSREKWQEAREKNSNTARQWEELRIEFASRKNKGGEDYNNSVESGYSDDKESSSDEETRGETDKVSSSEIQEENNSNKEIVEQTLKTDCEEKPEILTKQETHLLDALYERQTSREVRSTVAQDEDERSGLSEQDEKLLNSLYEKYESANTSAETSKREERLSRLEGECSTLVKQVVGTTQKSVTISDKLDVLHDRYGAEKKEEEPEKSSSTSNEEDNEE